MEEEKAAAYYEELTRKGSAAARFKQGLGFSNSSSSSSQSFSSTSSLSNFVKASSDPKTLENLQKQSQLDKIHNKLNKKGPNRENERGKELGRYWDRERGREREWERRRRDDSRSRSKSRERRGSNERRRWRRRSRSRERDDERRGRSMSRSLERREERKEKNKGKNDVVDYARLIEGYDKMTPAERVKAKMKLQLSEAVKKDSTMGSASGWERFEFDKDAPLDDDEIEAADDDAAVVKRMGQTFRYSKIEARREEEIKAAHDAAMFGTPAPAPSASSESEQDGDNERMEIDAKDSATNLISDKVLAKQQGSWRDRVRKCAP